MKLLIADDDKISAILLKKHASACGFEPIIVHNGEEAYGQLSRENGPRIALLDWMMPGITGVDIVQKIRAGKKDDRASHYLIVLTARSEKEDIVAALNAGADDYIVKPFDPGELKARLEVGKRILTLTDHLTKALDKAKRLSDFIAHFDQTTGLPNYLSLLERIESVQASPGFHALFLINLDNFKIINQIYGIGNGDLVLNYAGASIKQALGDDVFVSRATADEYAAILPLDGQDADVLNNQILARADRIHEVFSRPFAVEDDLITMTVSIGVSIITEGIEDNSDEFLRRADFALKRAKTAGGNRTEIHDFKAEQELQQRYKLERELKAAIEQEEIKMFLQPQCTKDGKAVAVEALARWIHPEKGLVSPGIFIPIAEQSDLIMAIGESMLEQACRLLVDTEGLGFSVSINVSPKQFQDPNYVDFVKSMISKTGADASRIILEVTEGLLIQDVDSIIGKMKLLAECGINFSVDDFGTGYSSLIYLKRLPIKELKIDRAFVKDLPHDKNDRAIVESIIAIARHMGFKLVAEGVETDEQVRFLASRGDMLYQGYYFAKPAPAREILKKYF